MKKPTEKELTAAIRKLLRQHGGFFLKHWGGPLSKVGTPDLIGCFEGKAVVIEVKGPKGRVSQEQEDFLRKWREAGGIAFVAHSVEDVIRELELPVLF
jgi:hypothetical protein